MGDKSPSEGERIRTGFGKKHPKNRSRVFYAVCTVMVRGVAFSTLGRVRRNTPSFN